MADKIVEVAPVHSTLSTVVPQSAPSPTAQSTEMRELRDLVAQLTTTINNFSLHTSQQHGHTERRRSRSPTRRSSSPFHNRAEVSVLPPRPSDRTHRQGYDLLAANSSTIATYGTRSSTINLGLPRSFPWIFTIADVNHAIIGADFLRHFNLLVDLRTRSLIDAVTQLRVNGITSPIPALSPVYAPFPPTPFTKLLGEYPDITRPTTKQTAVKHNVAQHIFTRGPPCSPRPRRLPPERLKIAKDEFQHMLDKGIIRPSSSSWASPLHMVPKSQPGDWRPCDAGTIVVLIVSPYLTNTPFHIFKISPPASMVKPSSPRLTSFELITKSLWLKTTFDKAQINQVEKQPDINIIAGNENGEADLSVLLVEENSKSSKPLKRKYKKKKSAKTVINLPSANANSNSNDSTGHLFQACIVHEDNDIGTASTSTGSCPNNASNLNASKLNNKSVEYNLPEDQSPTINAKHTKNVTVVVRDSMVRNLQGWRLYTEENHVVVKTFAGAKTSDMEDYVKPVIRKEPQKLILHVGTNDLKKSPPNRVAEGIANIATQIQEDSSGTEIVISSLLPRSDKPELSAKVNETNKLINAICCK
ncbi:gag-pol poly, partial [Paramuricea clavata]